MPTPTTLAPNAVPLSLLFVAMATMIMWFSAGIVGVVKPTLLRSFLSTIGVSLIAGAVVTAMSSFGTAAAIMLGVVGIVGVVWVIRLVFKIPTFPAFLIFVMNIMVQMLLMALYLRAAMPHPPPTK